MSARLKDIGSQRLYRPEDQATWPHLPRILTRPIRWDLIAQQYDQMVKYATALRLGTADAGPRVLIRKSVAARLSVNSFRRNA